MRHIVLDSSRFFCSRYLRCCSARCCLASCKRHSSDGQRRRMTKITIFCASGSCKVQSLRMIVTGNYYFLGERFDSVTRCLYIDLCLYHRGINSLACALPFLFLRVVRHAVEMMVVCYFGSDRLLHSWAHSSSQVYWTLYFFHR